MKPSAPYMFVLIAAVLVAVTGFRARDFDAERSTQDRGFVMGEDFSTLLSNPNLTLTVEQTGNSVVFVWTSPSPARLEEVRQMGEHMNKAKADLERAMDQRQLDMPSTAERQ